MRFYCLLIALASRSLAVRCGKDFGQVSCASDECCSEAGYCGKGTDFCKGPQCQINYSNENCDADQRPCGKATLMPRTQDSEVPYNIIIKSCTKPGTVALTFDDGPYEHTSHILDLLDQYNARATFFVSGNSIGKGMIDDPAGPYPALLRRMVNEGHQIGSHGWTHQDMDAVSEAQRARQVEYNEMAIRNVLGLIPRYFRPPYGVCSGNSDSSGCLAQMTKWGYHVVNWDLDTLDVYYNTPEMIQMSKDIVTAGIGSIYRPPPRPNPETPPPTNSHLVLLHDTQYQTAYNLTEYTLRHVQGLGYEFTTVGKCLGDDESLWYFDADETDYGEADNDECQECTPESIEPRQLELRPSEDGTCGARSGNKYTCEGSSYGDCCSYLGFCGFTSAYCDGGCQDDFGSCNTINCGDPPIVSNNGLCGGKTHQICLGSAYGDCCSEHGNCGSGDDYCGEGCQEFFGLCDE